MTEVQALIDEMADAPQDRDGLIEWHVARGIERARAEEIVDEMLAGPRDDVDT